MADKLTAAIVQARMGSNRLPGKVLMNISGRPMLSHVIERLRHCRKLDKIIIATSTNAADDAIEDLCRVDKVDLYRGSEADVLDRYYQAANLYGADTIVRITSDCPLIDPWVSDRVISAYLDGAADLDGASNTVRRTYPRGLDTEVISAETLKECWSRAGENYHREHVTVFVYEHPELFEIKSVENSEDLSSMRWTVDEMSDIEFAREIYKRLYVPGKIFLMEDILKVLSKEPGLVSINKDVVQKKVR